MSGIIFFDGICPLCNRTVALVFKIDKKRRFRYSSLQSGTAARLLDEYDRRGDSIVYLEDGRVYHRSEALLKIMDGLGGGWAVSGRLLKLIPRTVRNRLYDLVATNRYRLFGQLESCPVPGPEERAYYLE